MRLPRVWNLLRLLRCPACGRPAPEALPCPWCDAGRLPAAPGSRGDLALAWLGALAALGGTALPSPSVPPAVAGCFLSAVPGIALAAFARQAGAGASAPASALLAGSLALASRLAAPAWFGAAETLAASAWAAPLLLLAALLAAPEALPPRPAPTLRGRLAQRYGPPLLLAAPPLLVLAGAFAAAGATPWTLFFGAVPVAVLARRLRRPGLLLLPATVFFSLLLPDPSAFTLGICIASLAKSGE